MQRDSYDWKTLSLFQPQKPSILEVVFGMLFLSLPVHGFHPSSLFGFLLVRSLFPLTFSTRFCGLWLKDGRKRTRPVQIDVSKRISTQNQIDRVHINCFLAFDFQGCQR